DQVISAIDLSKVRDVSIGTFRISKDYLKQLRRNSEGSCVLYPFENREGYCVYPDEVRKKMISLVKDSLLEVMDGGKIYEY
ncbi:MAG: radical SAM protein, partial [Clostridiales bacterium]|nr:radical SAM protein [Clostridiales bacterium]